MQAETISIFFQMLMHHDESDLHMHFYFMVDIYDDCIDLSIFNYSLCLIFYQGRRGTLQ